MEIKVWFALLLGGFGLIAGSFLNVAAIRTLKKQPVVFPPSHCMHCRHPLRPSDLIPVISYILLKGRCRYCNNKIPTIYPVGEALAAVCYAWVGWHFGPLNAEWIAGLLLVSVLIVITHTDIKSMLIPDVVVFTGLALATALRFIVHPLPIWSYVAGAMAGFGVLYVIALVSRGGMGGGDIKLYLFIGAVCGLQITLLSLFVASLLGALWGGTVKLVGKLGPKQPIPFGPFIAIGAFLSFLYGEQWISSYMSWIMQ